MKKCLGAVSAGHSETAKSASDVLKDGGNAFDAVVAAHLTACVVEPVLASFAGGGFLMAETGDGEQTLYDFFVQTPLSIKKREELDFFPISADFGTTLQEFHIGVGSVATPGTVKGLFEIHNDLCSMPFSRLAEQAVALARDGIKMNTFQAGVLDVVSPIYMSNREARDIFGSFKESSELIQEGETLKQPLLGDFIEQLVRDDEAFFYKGEIAKKVTELCNAKGGHLTTDDFSRYEAIKRKPLQISYRDAAVAINPPPSSGGILIAFALKLMETMDRNSLEFGSVDYLHLLSQVQELTNKARVETRIDSLDSSENEGILHEPYVEMYRKQVKDRMHSSRGTTQISVIDGMGNTASLTTSNGSGSGVMIPGTGVMLNNMLGEEDLNPGGFYSWTPDKRISSMMAPVIARLDDDSRVVFGSGGSNRIRTAILQVLLNLIDMRMTPEEAVQSPRIHYESGLLNVEPGFSFDTLEAIAKKYSNHKFWKEQNLFFGGTHAVSGNQARFSGFGDPRRGGVSIVVEGKKSL